MSNSLKLIIAGVASIAVLSALAVLLLKGGGDEPSSSGSSLNSDTETVKLVDYEFTAIESVDIHQPGYDFAITAVDGEEGTFTLEGYEKLPVDKSLCYTIPNNLSNAEARLLVESTDNYEQYGLDDKTAIGLTVNGNDGKKSELLIGNSTPDGSDNYVKYKDKNEVYLVEHSKLANAFSTPLKLISTTLIEKPEDDAYPKINKVVIDRTDIDYDIVFEYDKTADLDITRGNSASHVMVEPINAYLNLTLSTPITHGIFGLTSTEAVVAYPKAEDFTQYGLDEPFCTVTTETENGNYVLKISKAVTVDNATLYYGYVDTIDAIFSFSASQIPWITLKPIDVISTLVFGTYVFDIGKLDVKTTNGNLLFEGSGDKDNYSVTLNGKSCDTEAFKLFYQFLLKAPAEEVSLEEPTGEPTASIILDRQDEYDGETVEFYDTGNRWYTIRHNGKVCFKCRAAYVERLLSNIECVLNGEEVVMTF